MKTLLIIFCLVFTLGATAQNVSINNTGNPADSTAMLDVSSTTKGMLIPRMTTAQRKMISSPAEGLLVYDTNSMSFWFYDTSGWVELVSGKLHEISDEDCDTWVTTEQGIDNDTISFFTDSIERARISGITLEMLNNGNSVFIGEEAGINFSGGTNRNVGIGYRSLNNDTDGRDNVAVGYQAMLSNTSGDENVALGYRALGTSSIGEYYRNVAIGRGALFGHQNGDGNVAIGYQSMNSSDTTYSNVAIGRFALQDITTGNNNVAIGDSSLKNNDYIYNVALGAKSGYENTSGNRNVFVGYSSGFENLDQANTFVGANSGRNNINGGVNTMLGSSAGRYSTGSRNVFVGFHSGYNSNGSDNVFIGGSSGFNANGSDKLYIENSNSSSPLIYGDFNLDEIILNGQLYVDYPSSPFTVKVNGDSKMLVSSLGNVGINVLFPQTKLHITGGSDAELADGTGYLTIGASGGQNIVIDDNEIMARNNAATDDLFLQVEGGNIGIGKSSAAYTLDMIGNMRVDVGLSDDLRMIDDAGDFKIFTTNSEAGLLGQYPNDEFLYVVSRFFQADVAANYMTYSDKKTKENILPVENALTKIQQLDGITYDIKPEIYYRSRLDKRESDRIGHFGYIAQQVEETFPKLVHHDKKNDLKMVGYMGLIPVLTEAIKDLAQQNDELQRQLDEQRAKRQNEVDNMKVELQGMRAELNNLKMKLINE